MTLHKIQKTAVTPKKKKAPTDLDTPIENVNEAFDKTETFGERVADNVAKFGGSWSFIIIFCLVLIVWMGVNVFHIFGIDFDPYPFILLNLFLSCVAAIQAPIIMMSQNRQAERDRADAENDYAVNIKAEKRIKKLQRKIDSASRYQWAKIVETQQEQIALLQKLLDEKEAATQKISISVTDDPKQNFVAINGIALNNDLPLNIKEVKIIANDTKDLITISYADHDGNQQTDISREKLPKSALPKKKSKSKSKNKDKTGKTKTDANKVKVVKAPNKDQTKEQLKNAGKQENSKDDSKNIQNKPAVKVSESMKAKPHVKATDKPKTE